MPTSGRGWRILISNWALSCLERSINWLGGRDRRSSPVAGVPTATGRVASLVVLNWRRPDNVRRILDRYVGYGCLDGIIVWNNNRASVFEYAHPKVRCINSDEFGLNTRWLGCLLARHGCVVVHDDDLVCDEATIESLVTYHDREPDRTYTLHGRNPTRANAYAEKVDHVTEPTECDVHLTRVACVNRRWVSGYFETLSATGLELDPARGGGEDIVFSYAMRAATGRRPLVVPGASEELLAPQALANRDGSQVAERTRIMRVCQRWLELESVGSHGKTEGFRSA